MNASTQNLAYLAKYYPLISNADRYNIRKSLSEGENVILRKLVKVWEE